MTARLVLLVPGDLATRTGGYAYDRAVVDGLRRRGWDVAVCALAGTYPQPDAAARAEARQRLAALPDGTCVLADGLAFGALDAEAEAEAARLRFVALVHHPLALETGLPPAAQASLRASERRALQTARAVVVTSEATVAALGPYGVPADRITVARPGTARAAVARGTRDRVGAAPDVPAALVCVATLTPRKGHARLIDALGHLSHRPWHLTCVGSLAMDPATARAVEAQGMARGLGGRVSLVGEAGDRALAAAYDAADAFVLPSEYEGYGMAVAEAVACGLPVVATRTGGIPELVDDASGVLVPCDADVATLASALDAVLDDVTRRRWRAGALVRRAALPDWDATLDHIEAALRQVMPHGTLQR